MLRNILPNTFYREHFKYFGRCPVFFKRYGSQGLFKLSGNSKRDLFCLLRSHVIVLHCKAFHFNLKNAMQSTAFFLDNARHVKYYAM